MFWGIGMVLEYCGAAGVKRERRAMERRLVVMGRIWSVEMETYRTILEAFELSECVDINCELLDAAKNYLFLIVEM